MPLSQEALDAINKKYKKSTIGSVATPLSQMKNDFVYVPSGLLVLDWVIGRPGLPKGRIAEFYGPNQSGKTALCLTIAKSIQEQGGDVLYVDAESAINPEWLSPLDPNRTIFVESENAEQGFDIIVDAVRGGTNLVIVDSVATLRPKDEDEASFEQQQRAVLARLMSKAMRHLPIEIAHSECILLMVNQVRSNMTMYGNPEVTSGGSALSFGASLRIRVAKKEPVKDGEQIIGQRSEIQVIKNKIGAPGRKADFYINYYGEDTGIDTLAAILDAAELAGITVKRGGYIYFTASGEKFAHGKASALQLLTEQPELAIKLRDEVWDTLR